MTMHRLSTSIASSSLRGLHASVLVAILLSACSDGGGTLTDIEPRFAPGTSGPPVKVTATDPTYGEQGDTLLVRVLGSNFEVGSTAEFTLAGVAAGKVHTNSTTFVSDNELLAEITIDGDAQLGFYDVEVITPRGKKGVGTELFQVTEKGGLGPPQDHPDADFYFDSGLAIAGDGSNDFITGVCGVRGTIWVGGTEDVTLKPTVDWDESLGCPKRFMTVDLTQGVNGEDLGAGSLTHAAIISLNEAVPDDGAWHEIPAQFTGPECDRLRFDARDTPWAFYNSRATWESDNVRAMRIAHPLTPGKRAWRVETRPPDIDGRHDMAVCFHSGKGNKFVLDGFFRIPFAITVLEH